MRLSLTIDRKNPGGAWRRRRAIAFQWGAANERAYRRLTGSGPAEWRAWWAVESRACGTDLQSLLRQHGRILREFWQHSLTLPSSWRAAYDRRKS
jgi:hypothetical protein